MNSALFRRAVAEHFNIEELTDVALDVYGRLVVEDIPQSATKSYIIMYLLRHCQVRGDCDQLALRLAKANRAASRPLLDAMTAVESKTSDLSGSDSVKVKLSLDFDTSGGISAANMRTAKAVLAAVLGIDEKYIEIEIGVGGNKLGDIDLTIREIDSTKFFRALSSPVVVEELADLGCRVKVTSVGGDSKRNPERESQMMLVIVGLVAISLFSLLAIYLGIAAVTSGDDMRPGTQPTADSYSTSDSGQEPPGAAHEDSVPLPTLAEVAEVIVPTDQPPETVIAETSISLPVTFTPLPSATPVAIPHHSPTPTLAPPTAVPTSIPEPTTTAVPTSPPEPTTTAVPTSTPEPTTTAVPTSIPEPTTTAVPTSTPEPATTAVPTSTPVPTAIAFETVAVTRIVLVTATPTATDTPTSTPTATPTATDTPTSTPTATDTPTSTPTATDIPTSTPTATDTPTSTPTATDTPTSTPTATDTPTSTPTATATATDIPTSTPTATDTPTSTPTAVPPDTPTATATATDIPTSTPTATPVAIGTPVPTPTEACPPPCPPGQTRKPTPAPAPPEPTGQQDGGRDLFLFAAPAVLFLIVLITRLTRFAVAVTWMRL